MMKHTNQTPDSNMLKRLLRCQFTLKESAHFVDHLGKIAEDMILLISKYNPLFLYKQRLTLTTDAELLVDNNGYARFITQENIPDNITLDQQQRKYKILITYDETNGAIAKVDKRKYIKGGNPSDSILITFDINHHLYAMKRLETNNPFVNEFFCNTMKMTIEHELRHILKMYRYEDKDISLQKGEDLEITFGEFEINEIVRKNINDALYMFSKDEHESYIQSVGSMVKSIFSSGTNKRNFIDSFSIRGVPEENRIEHLVIDAMNLTLIRNATRLTYLYDLLNKCLNDENSVLYTFLLFHKLKQGNIINYKFAKHFDDFSLEEYKMLTSIHYVNGIINNTIIPNPKNIKIAKKIIYGLYEKYEKDFYNITKHMLAECGAIIKNDVGEETLAPEYIDESRIVNLDDPINWMLHEHIKHNYKSVGLNPRDNGIFGGIII